MRFRHPPYVHVVRLRRASRLHRHLAWGGALVAAGLTVLAERQGFIERPELWLIAPAVLAWSALVRLVLDHGAVSIVRALGRLAIAAYLVVVIEHIGGWTFAATWPVLLIAVGIVNVAWALAGPRRDDGAGEEPTW